MLNSEDIITKFFLQALHIKRILRQKVNASYVISLNVSDYKVCIFMTNPVIEGQTELNTDALFSNNMTECEYSFHGFSFLTSKHVVLTDEKHFKGRSRCSVEFYDLPSGIIYVKVGPKLDGMTPSELMQSGQR